MTSNADWRLGGIARTSVATSSDTPTPKLVPHRSQAGSAGGRRARMGPFSHSRVKQSRISVSFASSKSVMAAVTTSRAASSSSDTSLALTGYPGCPRFCSVAGHPLVAVV